MRNLYPVAIIAGLSIGFLLYTAIVWYPYWEWLFFSAVTVVLAVVAFEFFWIEVQDLPEPFSYW